MKRALVYGAGGFIGSHMVNRLKEEGYYVVGIDLKYPEFEETQADLFLIADLAHDKPYSNYSFDEVYQFAADMGGAGYIFTGKHDANVMTNSALINLLLCYDLIQEGFKGKVFYSSSACMYPQEIQEDTDNKGLREEFAYPANPDSEYGWEKLFSERLYLAYKRNYNLDVRIARFHNIYGPNGTYVDPKAKAPAAMCRKVAQSKSRIKVGDSKKLEPTTFPYDPIAIWGDGEQTRSFLYIDDCIDAVRLLMQSDHSEPINIGSEEMVSINQLAQIAIDISGKEIEIEHDLNNKALGVRGRNSNNDLIRQVLNWEPKFTLRQGMERTYDWINKQVNKR